MSGGIVVMQYDTDPLADGTQKNPTGGSTILNGQQDFYSCGVRVGLAVRNTTTNTSGHVTAVTEDYVICDITFAYLDEYEIYKTTTYNSTISRTLTDKRYGFKTTDRAEMVDGLFPDDIDVDEHEHHVFGPGQPWQEKY